MAEQLALEQVAGSAAQLTRRRASSAPAELMDRSATSFFPVPVSPSSRIVAEVGATSLSGTAGTETCRCPPNSVDGCWPSIVASGVGLSLSAYAWFSMAVAPGVATVSIAGGDR